MLDLQIRGTGLRDGWRAADAAGDLDAKAATRIDAWPHAGMFVAMLDEVDYPMLLVAPGMALLHANTTALRQLNGRCPLQVARGQLVVPRAPDLAQLSRAVDAACGRGLRGLIRLGNEYDGETAVAVVPLQLGPGSTATLLMLARSRVCEELSVHCYAREVGLTAAETRVLSALCAGHSPHAIALAHGVALSTVRTQIGSLRAKTGAGDIGELVRKVVVLPPLVNALRPTLAHVRVAE